MHATLWVMVLSLVYFTKTNQVKQKKDHILILPINLYVDFSNL